jgi:hypothetical protein
MPGDELSDQTAPWQHVRRPLVYSINKWRAQINIKASVPAMSLFILVLGSIREFLPGFDQNMRVRFQLNSISFITPHLKQSG